MKKSFLFAIGLGFAASFWFFRLPHSYGRLISGYIIAIFQRDNGDIVIKMNNDKHDFIIQHALELNIDLRKLQSKLISKPSEIWFTHPKWPIDTTPHITRIICENKVIYTKW
jgi:hypothetical protein